ncbi:MAG: aldo/keto reductase [Pseudomonadota bacterium]
MHYRPLGRSGVEVSTLCLGTMTFGGRTDEAEARRIIDHARDQGVNFLDTADVYRNGASETIVGEALHATRSHWVLATKAGNAMGDGRNQRGLSKRWLIRACEGSLRRLKTDHVDLYYLHREDRHTPLEETVAGLRQLLHQGKIGAFGVSNFRAWRIAELCRLCDGAGIDRPLGCQPYYNALNRQAEVEVLPVCRHYGLGVVPYSPLARGLLTGKYAGNGSLPPDSRAAVRDGRLMETEWRPESLRIVDELLAWCEARGTTGPAFGLGWLLANELVCSVIAGPRTFAQWEGYLAALDVPFDPAAEAFWDGHVPPGHSSTHGYTDPAYPVEGRRATRA